MNDCGWWDRVSAAIDGELSGPELDRTLAHVDQCARCASALRTATVLRVQSAHTANSVTASASVPSARRWLSGQWTRRALLVAAVVIVAEAVPVYVRGSGMGAEAHAARHLATWQIGFGVGLLVAAWVSRLTHAMLALAATFATLTIAATVIDVARGHQGPWSESVHLVELIGVLLLWRITPAHFLPWRSRPPQTSTDHPDRATPASRGPNLRLVGKDSEDPNRS